MNPDPVPPADARKASIPAPPGIKDDVAPPSTADRPANIPAPPTGKGADIPAPSLGNTRDERVEQQTEVAETRPSKSPTTGSSGPAASTSHAALTLQVNDLIAYAVIFALAAIIGFALVRGIS